MTFKSYIKALREHRYNNLWLEMEIAFIIVYPLVKLLFIILKLYWRLNDKNN